MEKFIIIGDNFGVKITKIKYALKKNIDNQNWKWPKIKKKLKYENDSKMKTTKDKEDLKIKTFSKMRMISEIENDPK